MQKSGTNYGDHKWQQCTNDREDLNSFAGSQKRNKITDSETSVKMTWKNLSPEILLFSLQRCRRIEGPIMLDNFVEGQEL